jgi:hypothetical protein
MGRLVCGKGFNDGKYQVFVNGKITKEYNLWQSMLKRCFSVKFQLKRPTYIGCNVNDNFLSYSYFHEWCHKQIGFDKQGWHLDKDILILGNKIYSEVTCVFVPNEINLFFTDSGAARGEHPIGVYFHKRSGKYQAQCWVNGKQKYLGLFNTPESAFNAYKPVKEALCKELALKWQPEIDPRLFNAMMNWEVT